MVKNFTYVARTSFLATLIFLTAAWSAAIAQEGLYTKKMKPVSEEILPDQEPFFNGEEVIKVEIRTNIGRLIKSKSEEDPKYQVAKFSMPLGDSLILHKNIKLKARGNSRREICALPPIKLHFGKGEFLEEWFDNTNSLKLVNPCSYGPEYESYVLKEYLAYKIYQTITDNSFKVSLLQLTLKDTKKMHEDVTRYAFLIENDKMFEKRMGVQEIDKDLLSTNQMMDYLYLNPNPETLDNMNVLSLFQYLVGNTDWNVVSLHNLKLFERNGTYFPVPYDFDYAGLVNAKYAKPSSSLPTTSVTERIYQGPCSEFSNMRDAVDLVLSKKGSIYAEFENSRLKGIPKRETKKYLDEFFTQLTSISQFTRDMATSNCSEAVVGKNPN